MYHIVTVIQPNNSSVS